tara:strand:- start:7256 stop:7846 length:591 start_codon:yes stop_codon:yes gene_type:complete
MSLLELLVAMALLTIFTGVVAAVMEATLRFAGEAECTEVSSSSRVCNQINSTDVADGALINRVRIEFLFDQMEEVLVQPGVNVVQLLRISSPLNSAVPSLSKCIATPSSINPGRYQWKLSDIPELPELVNFPLGYRLCLWSTDLVESSMECLLDPTLNTCTRPVSPGVYVLQALPYKLSASNLPVRRLFCRPRPFC